ncbi:hypothetical protein [Nocardioides sp.]|uniref:hypothetical protein n=1 Tax=Nocardioides sp. TaxID=35761 RepID=UPI0027348403|nr:hypothetical protein [Nocardioides sp.]MDP3894176.1 hypothetical protein [Nocardioides sp.]
MTTPLHTRFPHLRRLAGVSALVLLAPFVGAAPASATDSTVVHHGLSFPDAWGLFNTALSCSHPTPLLGGGIQSAWAPTPPGPGMGLESPGYQFTHPHDAVGMAYSAPVIGDVTVASIDVNTPTGAQGVAYATFAAPGDNNHYWLGRADLAAPVSDSWQTVSAIGLTFWWSRYTNDGQSAGAPEQSTLSAMLASKGAQASAGYYFIGFGCDTGGFYTDRWQIGTAEGTTTYDIEAWLTKIAVTGSPGTVTAGDGVALTGRLSTVENLPLGQRTLILEARPYGAPSFSPVGTATTSDGQSALARLTVKPPTQTQYRWRYDSTLSTRGSVSPSFTVKVRTAVTAKAALKKGSKILVKGRVTPAKGGAPATLWRATKSGKKKLKSTTINENGSYQVKVAAKKKGVWKLFVTVPARTGNLAGTSPTRKVRVR